MQIYYTFYSSLKFNDKTKTLKKVKPKFDRFTLVKIVLTYKCHSKISTMIVNRKRSKITIYFGQTFSVFKIIAFDQTYCQKTNEIFISF